MGVCLGATMLARYFGWEVDTAPLASQALGHCTPAHGSRQGWHVWVVCLCWRDDAGKRLRHAFGVSSTNHVQGCPHFDMEVISYAKLGGTTCKESGSAQTGTRATLRPVFLVSPSLVFFFFENLKIPSGSCLIFFRYCWVPFCFSVKSIVPYFLVDSAFNRV